MHFKQCLRNRGVGVLALVRIHTSINCHEHGAELQDRSLESGENHINSSFDFHDTACLFLLGVGY